MNSSYAPRYKSWPPAGYVAPTADEFAALARTVHRRTTGVMTAGRWARVPDAELIRHMHLLEILPPGVVDERAAYDYATGVSRETGRRGLVRRSIAVLRCECCSHGTERLFEATQDTHPGMEDRHGDPADSAWFCVRCWSGDETDD